MIEQYDLRRKVELYFIGTILVLAILYGVFRAYPLIAGPSISLNELKDGSIVSSSTFQITGRVTRADIITLQGKPIKIDPEGNFRETLVAYSPYTILVLVATDKYGATVSETLRVIPKD